MQNKLLFNKRGDSIPIFILVIGVLSICILTLISFISSAPKQKILGIDAFEEIYSELERFHFYIETDTRDVSYLEKAKSSVEKVNFILNGNAMSKSVLSIQGNKNEEYLLIKKEVYSCSIAIIYKISLKELESRERI
ncbi:MAG TPA: hypothetical protein PLK34_00445 [Candidatus Pacearchaeota archaeon]|nr:hypothetical protein [Candidatus Pacearchaeota archaeon]